MKRRGFIALIQRGGLVRSMIFCATVLSLTIATAVASAQTPSPSAAAPAASPEDKQAISKACSDQADAKGLHGKVRKKFRSACKKRGGAPQ
jgi:invasion protein IalB